jgi:hypothetical protein
MTLAFSSCTKNESIVGNDQIVGSGNIVSQVRAVGSFTGIQVTNLANVYVTQNPTESLRIEADDNIITRVGTSVVNGVLVVGLSEGSYNHVTVRVYASMAAVKRLESNGAAAMVSTNALQTDSITCRIVGAGNITLTGSATYEFAEIVGAGSINNFNLVVQSCNAIISGAGNIEVNVTQRLDATINGAGAITYAGNPGVIHPVVVGVGSVRPRP